MAKDLGRVEDNIGEIKVELHEIAVDREKRKIGQTLLGAGGFVHVMASSLKRKQTKAAKKQYNKSSLGGNARATCKETLIDQYKSSSTLHSRKHRRTETKDEYSKVQLKGQNT